MVFISMLGPLIKRLTSMCAANKGFIQVTNLIVAGAATIEFVIIRFVTCKNLLLDNLFQLRTYLIHSISLSAVSLYFCCYNPLIFQEKKFHAVVIGNKNAIKLPTKSKTGRTWKSPHYGMGDNEVWYSRSYME